MLKDVKRRRRGGRLRIGVLAVATALVVSGLSATQAGASRSAKVTYDDNATVVFAGTPVGQDMDPYKAGGTLVGIVDLYDSLLRATPKLKLVPSLATAWKYSADNLTLTLTLRDGVKFGDGTAFDSAAVVASLNRARSGSTSQQKLALSSISNVAAPSANTVVITLSHPDATLLNILAGPAAMVINPKFISNDTVIRAGTEKGLGTGAYFLRSFAVGTKMILDRNDNYWDKAAVQHAPKVFEYDIVFDGSARLNGLKTGAYMGVQAVGTSGLGGSPGSLTDTDKHYKWAVVPSIPMYGLGFHVDRPPFNNEQVRLAVAHALDLAQYTSTLGADAQNCAAKPDPQLWLPGWTGYDPTLKPLKFDLKLAKQELAAAGFPDGKGFPTITMAGTVASADIYAVQAFQGMLARIGINVVVDTQPSRVFVLAEFTSGKAQAITYSFGGTNPDPSAAIDERVISVPFIDPNSDLGKQYTTLAASAKTEVDVTKRATIYKQLSKLAVDHAMYIPFCRPLTGYGTTANISNMDASIYNNSGVTEVQFIRVAKGK